MRKLALISVLVLFSMVLTTCTSAPSTPQVVRETVETEKIVEREKEVVVTPTPEPVKLVMLTHYAEEETVNLMQGKLDRYMELHPNVTIEHQAVSFDQLLTKITTARAAGISPDIYHFYDLWLPDFVGGGMLAVPPDEVVADIKANYSPGSVDAVTYRGQVWGHPTELDIYMLLYNKKLLAEVGYSKPPETWDELREMSAAITKVDETGAYERVGYLLMPGWDSGVVHPFLSFLWSNGGEFLSPDGTQCLVDSAKGQETMQLYMDLLSSHGTDTSVDGFDFPNGAGAMIIMANWWQATLKTSFADGYENVGVAPIPHGPGGQPVPLQYNWMYGVDNGSQHRKEAWDLVTWLNSPESEDGLSPMGDFLNVGFGAIPSRLSDQEALAPEYDSFLQAFVDGAATARPEPIVRGGQEVKTLLQTELEAAWFGQKPPEQALTDAATEGTRILTEKQ